jgi:zona occludens toxin (predicted ATPase)
MLRGTWLAGAGALKCFMHSERVTALTPTPVDVNASPWQDRFTEICRQHIRDVPSSAEVLD